MRGMTGGNVETGFDVEGQLRRAWAIAEDMGYGQAPNNLNAQALRWAFGTDQVEWLEERAAAGAQDRIYFRPAVDPHATDPLNDFMLNRVGMSPADYDIWEDLWSKYSADDHNYGTRNDGMAVPLGLRVMLGDIRRPFTNEPLQEVGLVHTDETPQAQFEMFHLEKEELSKRGVKLLLPTVVDMVAVNVQLAKTDEPALDQDGHRTNLIAYDPARVDAKKGTAGVFQPASRTYAAGRFDMYGTAFGVQSPQIGIRRIIAPN